ncbi:hypothetical protein GOC31_06485 [Sinorhizobium meliloti]|nr:hypothetical protein [Sinorhizobium meliloti]MDX0248374.1 hypothetical protein [Sinorhizobium meliloti]
MVISLARIVDLFRRKKPTLAEALAKSGFRPASTARIAVRQRRNRERLVRH